MERVTLALPYPAEPQAHGRVPGVEEQLCRGSKESYAGPCHKLGVLSGA